MSDVKYVSRIIESKILKSLENIGAICLLGPKYCGKTTTSKKLSKSFYYLQELGLKNIEVLDFTPELIMDGDKPRLIDEWQIVPRVWDLARFNIDKKDEDGLYILTTSKTINRNNIIHSGAGRVLIIEMTTMSLFESNESDGKISLTDLFNGTKFDKFASNKTIKDIVFCMCRGGWPEVVCSNKNYYEVLKSYFEDMTFFENEFGKNNSYKINELIKSIVKALSKNNTLQIKDTTIVSDLNNEISRITFKKYYEYLKSIYLIFEIFPWATDNFRSKSKMLTSPKMYFSDQSIGLFSLKINENNIFKDLNTFGLYFENLVIRDLKVYAQSIGGELFFYRDNNGFEVDLIIELRDGRWAAFEIKLGDRQLDKAANNLINFKNKIKPEFPPAFLAIITSSPYAYIREDGVYVIPIQSLKN